MKPPAHLRPYVEALGETKAIQLFLSFGGSQIYLAADPKGRSSLAKEMGLDATRALSRALGPGHVKVPLGRQWVAARLVAGGASIAEAARRVRADEATVRRWLGPAESRQFSLFD